MTRSARTGGVVLAGLLCLALPSCVALPSKLITGSVRSDDHSATAPSGGELSNASSFGEHAVAEGTHADSTERRKTFQARPRADVVNASSSAAMTDGQVKAAGFDDDELSPVQFTPAESRTPAVSFTADRNDSAFRDEGFALDQADVHSEEYLFDGGDRDLPVHYDSFHRLGLDTEDTVAEYQDDDGELHVEPSNRVSLYAPRFGVVQTVSGVHSGTSIERATGAHEATGGLGLRTRIPVGLHSQRDSADGVRMRSRASGVEGETKQAAADQSARPAAHEMLQNVYENLIFFATGQLDHAEQARLAYGIQAALVWTRDQYPVLAATTAAAQQVETAFNASVMVGSEESDKTKGRLRIVKVADKKSAKPGDIVTFTIRYDNLGQRELFDIRIVDNLTPRLQYIDDSADSDRAGRLVVDDNGQGSVVLEFEFDEPLPGGEGGVVTFEARVR